MMRREIVIVNRLGLHARAASKFVTRASTFQSDVRLQRDAQEVNGKSIMGVMMLAASKGTRLTLTTEGSDEREAIDSLEELIEQRFGEDQ